MYLTRFLSLCIGLSVSICTIAQQQKPSATVDRNNKFTLDFYYSLAHESATNVLVSPFSLSSALAMVYPGARNKTAEQMSTALQFSNDLGEHNLGFRSVFDALNLPGSPLAVSNEVWIEQSANIPPDYLDITTTYFRAGVKKTDFKFNAEQSRLAINQSVEKQTKNEIKELLPQGSISQYTRMVLTNAVYFKDTWRKAFDPKRSKMDVFHSGPKTIVQRMFMEQDGKFPYFENDIVSVLELPYQNNFSMLIILPKKDIPEVHNYFTNEYYNSWAFRVVEFKKIQIPRFSIRSEVKTEPILKSFGMTDIFEEELANLSGIVDGYYVSGIFHKAFIDVNEEGTTAAAATAVVIDHRSMPDRVNDFIANKPFIFLLRDTQTGSIIFIGKVEDPGR